MRTRLIYYVPHASFEPKRPLIEPTPKHILWRKSYLSTMSEWQISGPRQLSVVFQQFTKSLLKVPSRPFSQFSGKSWQSILQQLQGTAIVNRARSNDGHSACDLVTNWIHMKKTNDTDHICEKFLFSPTNLCSKEISFLVGLWCCF